MVYADDGLNSPWFSMDSSGTITLVSTNTGVPVYKNPFVYTVGISATMGT
jgi:hypothetical protein